MTPPTSLSASHLAAEDLAVSLARDWTERVSTVTWLNHYTALVVERSSAWTILDKITRVEVDGILLQRIVDARTRTSADLVVPVLLPKLNGCRLALIGGRQEQQGSVAAALARLMQPTAAIVAQVDGYDGMRNLDVPRWLAEHAPDVVLIGLGGGYQDEVAVAVASHMRTGLVLTCGGFLDQVVQDRYYPPWAYRLKLNWLVRLWHEPRRLWRRYTLDAARAVTHRRQLRSRVTSLRGFRGRAS